MGLRDVDVVIDHRNGCEDVIEELLPSGLGRTLGQLNSDPQFCHGDRGNCHLIVVVDQTADFVTPSIAVDQEGRVKQQPAQDLSSTVRRSRISEKLFTPARISTMPMKHRLHLSTAPAQHGLDEGYRLASAHDREPLTSVLNGVEEIGKVSSRLGGADLGHEIRLSNIRLTPTPGGRSPTRHL